MLARALGVWALAVAPRTGLGKAAAVTVSLAFASPDPSCLKNAVLSVVVPSASLVRLKMSCESENEFLKLA